MSKSVVVHKLCLVRMQKRKQSFASLVCRERARTIFRFATPISRTNGMTRRKRFFRRICGFTLHPIRRSPNLGCSLFEQQR